MRHAATRSLFGDRLARGAFRADEQHLAAVGDDTANEGQRLLIERQRLLEIDDVDFVALTEDER